MSLKTKKILYWVFTLLFSGLMIYTSIDGIGPGQKTLEVFNKFLGYPVYFIQFISWAKIAGSIVILIPGVKLNKIKEWAYAGLFFDLAGATYSGVAALGQFNPQMLFMLLWIVPGVLSYIFWNQINKFNNEVPDLIESRKS